MIDQSRSLSNVACCLINNWAIVTWPFRCRIRTADPALISYQSFIAATVYGDCEFCWRILCQVLDRCQRLPWLIRLNKVALHPARCFPVMLRCLRVTELKVTFMKTSNRIFNYVMFVDDFSKMMREFYCVTGTQSSGRTAHLILYFANRWCFMSHIILTNHGTRLSVGPTKWLLCMYKGRRDVLLVFAMCQVEPVSTMCPVLGAVYKHPTWVGNGNPASTMWEFSHDTLNLCLVTPAFIDNLVRGDSATL